MTNYPAPLKPGDTFGLTSVSSPVPRAFHNRFSLAVSTLKSQGFNITEGNFLYGEEPFDPKLVAKEFMDFWLSDDVHAVVPPWGGELAIRMLEHIDFNLIKNAKPKWIFGFSDISTLMFPITLCAGVATVHGSNLMDLVPNQDDPLTTCLLKSLSLNHGDSFTQFSSERYQKNWPDIASDIHGRFDLTEDTAWGVIPRNYLDNEFSVSGRIVGGCLDTLTRLVGTPYADLASFRKQFDGEALILFLENAEMNVFDLTRSLYQLKYAGWLEQLSGVVFGRSTAVTNDDQRSLHLRAIEQCFVEYDYPVIVEADIGHMPPQLNIINGSHCDILFDDSKASVTQWLI